MRNRPKHLTEPPIRYTSILRTARLQMSSVRANDGALSSAETSPNSDMDCEMDDFDDGFAAVNKHLQQSAQPITTDPLQKMKPASKAATAASGDSSNQRDARATPVCICQTCEREATEAKAAAAASSPPHWSLASLPRGENGAVGYGYRHRSQGTADIWTNASKHAE